MPDRDSILTLERPPAKGPPLLPPDGLRPNGLRPTVPRTRPDERPARQSLREQITRLESELQALFCTTYPRTGFDWKVPSRGGPRVLSLAELEQLRDELAHGDVAAVLMEPALTNIGIVLPEPGYLETVRALTREHGTLLINDETHTFSAGPGGATRAWNLEPDIVTIGKAIAGGVPCGAFGITDELAGWIAAERDADLVDTGGVGGTLAGNALSLAAARATLEHVLTDDAFARMTALATRFATGVEQAIRERELPWSVAQIGARVEYRFASPPPRTGSESAAADDPDLEDFLHVYLANRDVLITPFHLMALMSPATTEADVDRHTELFGDALDRLT